MSRQIAETEVQFQWATPVASGRGRYPRKPKSPWAKAHRELRQNPGKWAIIRSSEKQVACPKEFQTSDYERLFRKVDNKHVIYVRYIKGAEEAQ